MAQKEQWGILTKSDSPLAKKSLIKPQFLQTVLFVKVNIAITIKSTLQRSFKKYLQLFINSDLFSYCEINSLIQCTNIRSIIL